MHYVACLLLVCLSFSSPSELLLRQGKHEEEALIDSQECRKTTTGRKQNLRKKCLFYPFYPFAMGEESGDCP